MYLSLWLKGQPLWNKPLCISIILKYKSNYDQNKNIKFTFLVCFREDEACLCLPFAHPRSHLQQLFPGLTPLIYLPRVQRKIQRAVARVSRVTWLKKRKSPSRRESQLTICRRQRENGFARCAWKCRVISRAHASMCVLCIWRLGIIRVSIAWRNSRRARWQECMKKRANSGQGKGPCEVWDLRYESLSSLYWDLRVRLRLRSWDIKTLKFKSVLYYRNSKHNSLVRTEWKII